MKTNKLIKELDSTYKIRSVEFNNLISFLKYNHIIVEDFNKKTVSDLVYKGRNAKERLYFLLNDCLNAAGGNSLTRNGSTMKHFILALNKLPNSKEISFANLCSIFDVKPDYTGQLLFDKLKSSYPNFKYKKAALFIKQLYYLQQTEERIFFSDPKLNIIRPIPFDAVIAFTIRNLLNLKEKMSSSEAEIFNKWALDNFKEKAYLLEDIWFWGFFNTTNSQSKREFKYNIDKVNMNIWDYPGNIEIHNDKFIQFIELVNT